MKAKAIPRHQPVRLPAAFVHWWLSEPGSSDSPPARPDAAPARTRDTARSDHGPSPDQPAAVGG
jgi:hypothetical protein